METEQIEISLEKIALGNFIDQLKAVERKYSHGNIVFEVTGMLNIWYQDMIPRVACYLIKEKEDDDT